MIICALQFPTGHYIYIDTTSVALGDTGLLQSQDYSHTGARCITFSYQMSGPSPGTLSVYKQNDGDLFITPSWSKTGDQGNRWGTGQVEIVPTQGKSYKVSIIPINS